MERLSSVLLTTTTLLLVASLPKGSNAITANEFYYERPYIGPSIWIYGLDELSIYSIDGSTKLKSLSNHDVCFDSTTSTTNDIISELCIFRNALSDGHDYVWASESVGGDDDDSKLVLFSSDTGEFVASLPVCSSSSSSMDYHPNRKEIWTYCSNGTISVFTSHSFLNARHQQIHISSNNNNNNNPNTYNNLGQTLMDPTLGNYGFLTNLHSPYLHRVNLNTKTIVQKVEMPLAYGLDRMAYSPLNKHLYIRAYVCCSCGFEGADLDECNDNDDIIFVNVTTGPNLGQTNVDGTCGHECQASPADVVGVYEYDTINDQIIDKWELANGFAANPFASSYGDNIVLIGKDGGQYVARILHPGVNGAPSSFLTDIHLEFSTTNNNNEVNTIEATFVRDSKRNIIILSSTYDNFIVLVDMSKSIPILHKHNFASDDDEPWDVGINHVVWAVGTNYIWLGSKSRKKQYVIQLNDDTYDITKSQWIQTIHNVGHVSVYVKNYWKEEMVNIMGEMIVDDVPMPAPPAPVSPPVSPPAVDEQAIIQDVKSAVLEELAKENTAKNLEHQEGDDEGVDGVGIVAIIIALLSLILTVANIVADRHGSSSSSSSSGVDRAMIVNGVTPSSGMDGSGGGGGVFMEEESSQQLT